MQKKIWLMLMCMFALPRAWAAAPVAQAAANTLTVAGIVSVEVSGLRNDRGNVKMTLYRSRDGFPDRPEKALQQLVVEIHDGRAWAQFGGVAEGVYAVSVMHDENDNAKLDSNFFGIPSEGVGASNHAKGKFGPPKFEDAKFKHDGRRSDLKISLEYL